MTTATVSAPVFNLSEKQKNFYWDSRRFVVYIGGRATGKTTSAIMRLKGMIDRGELKPGSRILVIGPDYTQAMDGTLKSFDYWFDLFGMITRKVNGGKPMRELCGSIEVLFRSAMNLDQTRSKECQVVWLDEAAQMDEGIFTLTNANVRGTGFRDDETVYQTIITTTPRGKNWLWRRFANPETAFDEDQLGYYHMTTVEAEEEGIARPGYVEELGYEVGSQMYQQEVMAEYVAWTGLVFRQGWKNCDKACEGHQPYRYIVGGVDVGSVTPSSIVLTAIDDSDNYYVFKEFYAPRTDPHVLMALIGEWHREFGVNKWVVDDPDMFKQLRHAGLPSSFPNKQKDAAGSSVNFINSLISRGKFHIDEHACPMLVKEMTTYAYKSKTSGDEVTFLDKVQPNQAEHAIDPLRYACRILSSWTLSRQNGWGAIAFGSGSAR